jgi:hypothetical protein
MRQLSLEELQTYAGILLDGYKRRAEMTYTEDTSGVLLNLYSNIMDRPFSGSHKQKERIALEATLELKKTYEQQEQKHHTKKP